MVTIQNSINNTVGASNSGVNNTLTIQNPSNTASSASTCLINVGGTSSGNPSTQWAVGTTRAWGLGIENGASQRLTLSTDAAGTVTPGGGNYIYSVVAGATSFLSSMTFWIPTMALGGLSNPGAPVNFNIANTSATAGSDATLSLQVNNGGGAGGGNSYISYTGPADNWFLGCNKTGASNAFQLQHAVVGTFPTATTFFNVTTTGNITKPASSIVLASLTNAAANVTGDGTVFTIPFNNVVKDQNTNFNSTTGVFTAPVTGTYQVSVSVTLTGLTSAMTGVSQLNAVATSRTITLLDCNFAAIRDSGNNMTISGTALIDMTAANTLSITVAVAGGAKVVAVNNAASNTWVGITLIG